MFISSIICKAKQQILRSDIAKRMFSGVSWTLLGTVFAKLSLLVAGIIVARILGQELYGEFGMAKSTMSMLMVFGSAGLGITATKYIAEFRVGQPEKIPNVYMVTNVFAVIVALVVMLFVYIFAETLSVDLLHTNSLTNPMRVVAVAIFFVIINLAQEGVLAGFEDFKHKSINNIFSNIIQGGTMILGAYMGGVFGAVCGYGLGFFILLIFNKKTINLNFKKYNLICSLKSLKIEDFRILYSYSLPAAISSILAAPTYWIIKTLLARNTGFSEVAVFDVSDQWRMFVLFIPAAVCQIALPLLSSISDNDVKKFKKVLNTNILLNVGIAFITSLILILFSSLVMSFYGDDFSDTTPFIIMIVSSVFTSISTILGVAISSKAKMWTWCAFNVLWAIVAIYSSYIYIHMGMGAKGASLGILTSFILHALVQFVYVRYLIQKMSLKNAQ